ncbi:Nucleotide-binding oligomerization domain-containing protein 1 [Hondaea fermentalgiana]|uniref:Nucleotide-binding oligomerization domain-containing protein 1 n=1 Tax=Hondaea fermentalgiana TaxID=2315210 RepID=A0A2R5G3G2_9STRA|nr:Nucleotide-binding oligomerization domain-containing protein 1 [Hondaea fermentalgiana]|eukprot:GBG24859.1 Nucleotide-binding oligomerization domain-containing protein 1 [Hondaea fermentalgiana]
MKSFTASLFRYASRMSEAERTSPSARSAGHGDDESRNLAENEVRDPNDEGDHVQETGSLHGDNGGDDGGDDGGGQEHDNDDDNDGSGGGGGDRSDDENDDQVPEDGIEDRLRGLDAVHAAIALMRKGVKELDLADRGIGDEDAEVLGEELGKNASLVSLNLGGNWWEDRNAIGPTGALAIAEALTMGCPLKVLNLHNNSVGDEGAAEIGRGLRETKSLTLLNLQWNNIGPAGGQTYTDIVEGPFPPTIAMHSLQKNRIGDSGAIGLGKGVSKNRSLKELMYVCCALEDNKIGASGTIALGDALSNNSSLDSLILRGNKIGDKGAVGLGKGLGKNSSLTSLVLGGNEINCEGIASLAELILTENDTLVQVL